MPDGPAAAPRREERKLVKNFCSSKSNGWSGWCSKISRGMGSLGNVASDGHEENPKFPECLEPRSRPPMLAAQTTILPIALNRARGRPALESTFKEERRGSFFFPAFGVGVTRPSAAAAFRNFHDESFCNADHIVAHFAITFLRHGGSRHQSRV